MVHKYHPKTQNTPLKLYIKESPRLNMYKSLKNQKFRNYKEVIEMKDKMRHKVEERERLEASHTREKSDESLLGHHLGPFYITSHHHRSQTGAIQGTRAAHIFISFGLSFGLNFGPRYWAMGAVSD